MYRDKAAGFSLVELSIVLVILGLLVGGVLGGQSLIKAAQLRKVTTEFSAYQTATNAFRVKYMELPGDFSKAQMFWTPATTCGTMSASMTAGTMDGTCNGNGNGVIYQFVTGGATMMEAHLYWQHLSLAQLIPTQIDLNLDMAASNLSARHETVTPRSSWGSIHWLVYQTTTDVFGNNGTAHFRLYSYGGAAAGPSMTPEDTWSLDTKMDDGKPATGKFLTVVGGTCTLKPDGTATTATDMDADYNLATQAEVCTPVIYFL